LSILEGVLGLAFRFAQDVLAHHAGDEEPPRAANDRAQDKRCKRRCVNCKRRQYEYGGHAISFPAGRFYDNSPPRLEHVAGTVIGTAKH